MNPTNIHPPSDTVPTFSHILLKILKSSRLILSIAIVALVTFTGCAKKYSPLEKQPAIEDIVGVWKTDGNRSTKTLKANSTIILLPDQLAVIENLPIDWMEKVDDTNPTYIGGKGMWRLVKWKSWKINIRTHDSNRWHEIDLERDGDEIILNYYLSPEWPRGIIFKKQNASESTQDMKNTFR